jgi:HAD superfamily hydrolase (TIGR01509 family)
MRFSAILFDFDGVLLESEWAGNADLAAYLTRQGRPTSVHDAMREFMGLAGDDFDGAICRWLGGPLPEDFHRSRAALDERMIAEGVAEVAGAVKFVRGLDAALPKAVVSSSSRHWIAAHLANLGLADCFAGHLYSGREHVGRGKPAPDLYLHAAERLGVPITRCLVIEDSPVGATGAVESGAIVVGLLAGSHVGPDHAQLLGDIGVHHLAHSFDEVAALLD